MNTQFVELTDNDLEQVDGAAKNQPLIDALGWAAVVWHQCGCNNGGFWRGMQIANGAE
jgi:hypothetical protein